MISADNTVNPNGDKTVPWSAPTPHNYITQESSKTLTHSANVALCDLLFLFVFIFYGGPVSSSDLDSFMI